MSERSIQRVLAHSGELQRAGTLDELIRVANSAVRDVSRFRTAWLAWLDRLWRYPVARLLGLPP